MSNATADPRCVGCRYDLTGADVNANCPECGMAARLTVDSSVRDRYVGMQRLASGLRRLAFSLFGLLIAGVAATAIDTLRRVRMLDEESVAFVAAMSLGGLVSIGSVVLFIAAIVGLVRRPTTRAWPSLTRAARRLVLTIGLGIVSMIVVMLMSYVSRMDMRVLMIAGVTAAAVAVAIDFAILRYLVASASALHRIASWPRIVTFLLVVRFLAGCAAALASMAGTPFHVDAMDEEGPLTPADRLEESLSFASHLVGYVVSCLLALSALRLSRNVEPAELALWAPEIPATNS